MEAVLEMQNALDNQSDFRFRTDKLTYSIGLKGDKSAYVTGYISTSDVDLYNDLITAEALADMLVQIKATTITIDYDHEAFREDSSILPVGKIVEAKIDERGLWVKCKLNKHSPKFDALWGSIKEGFVNAFSIAFKPVEVSEQMVGDVKVRMIKALKLLNVALTGVPVNEEARVDGFDMKSVMLKAINETTEEQVVVSKSLLTKLMEEKSMEDKEVAEKAKLEADLKAKEEAETKAELKAEEDAKAEAEKKASDDATLKENNEVEKKALADLTKNVEDLTKANAELRADLKALKETEVFKSPAAQAPDLKSQDKPVGMLSLIG